MTDSKELALQGSLSPEVFSRFINLKVGMSLGGSASFDLEELEKIMAGDPLGKGTELIITARYFVKDVRMPVERKEDYSIPWEQRQKQGGHVYQLGGAKIDLTLIGVEKVETKQGKIKQTIAAPCECLVKNEPDVEKPSPGYVAAAYPLRGFWANSACEGCHGRGYVFPRKNKAPLSDEVSASYGEIIVLVDQLPEAPDIPSGWCQTCGREFHTYDCPVRLEEDKAAKAKARAQKKAEKKIAKDAGADSGKVEGSESHVCPHGPDPGENCPCHLEAECLVIADVENRCPNDINVQCPCMLGDECEIRE